MLDWGFQIDSFEMHDILLGVNKAPVINHLIICSKYFFYINSIKKIRPDIKGLIAFWKVYYNTERDIGFKNNTLEKFSKKWGGVSKLFEKD